MFRKQKDWCQTESQLSPCSLGSRVCTLHQFPWTFSSRNQTLSTVDICLFSSTHLFVSSWPCLLTTSPPQQALNSWLGITEQRVPPRLARAVAAPCKSLLSSAQFSRSVVSDPLQPQESQHARPPCPSLTPRVYSNSCPSSRWWHQATSSSVVLFSSCLQSLPASGSFPMNQLFSWGGQSIGVWASASVLPMNTQDWSPLGKTGWISLQSKGLSKTPRVFSNTTVQKHQFF